MIVIMSLLDDVPIMTIAYDNTPVSERRSAGRCRECSSISACSGSSAVVQSFALLLIGIKALSDPSLRWFDLADRSRP